MGIQQIGAALSQARSPTVADEATELAGSRAPPRAPERQRGLWSFLTWPFVIAPIVTAEAFFAKNASPLNNSLDDQSNYAAVVDKGPADAAADHDSSALAGVVVDNSQEDDLDALPLKGAARNVSHSGNPSNDGSANHWALRDADAGSSPAGDAGGGGGGGGSAGANDAPASADSVANFQDVDALPNDKQDSPIGQSPAAEETPDGPSSGAAVESSDSVGLVDISVGEGTVLASATSEVISSDTTSVPKMILSTPVNLISTATSAALEIISPVGLDTPLNLKDILGFDLHVNGAGEFVANDLSTALDVNPSQLVADVSTAIGLATEDLPQLDFGASKTLDNLLGNGLLDVGHLSDPISDLSSVFAKTGLGSDLGSDAGAALEKLSASALSISHESGSNTNLLDLRSSNDVDGLSGGKGLLDVGHLSEVIPEPSSAVPTSGLSNDLGSTAGTTLEKVGGPALSISQESGANTDLSTVSIVSDAPHVGIVGEATDLTPGHSVDFPAQPAPEGDVLFSGTNYTDYHVALNTGVSSSAVNGIAATTTTVTHTHDAASVSPVDSPNASHASEPSAPEHHDVSLLQVSNVVDELGVRGHSH